MFRKIHKKLTAVLLSCALLVSASACDSVSTGGNSGDPRAWLRALSARGYTDDTPSGSNDTSEQEKFDEFLDEEFKETVTSDSITLHYNVIHPENYGITPPDPTFGDLDISEEAVEKEKKEDEETLARLTAFDRSKLTAEQKYTYDLLKDLYNDSIESAKYAYLQEPFAYTSGLQSNIPIAMSEYKLYGREDVDTYLALVALLPDYFNVCLELEDIKIEKGLFMNSASADKVIEQCEKFIKDPEKNLLIETFNSNIENVESLTKEEIDDYKEKNRSLIIDEVIPVYEKTIDYFKENREKGKNEKGLCYLENGKEYYAFLMRHQTGTDKTPEELCARLDKAIQDEMTSLYTIVYKDYDLYDQYTKDMEDFYQGLDPEETIRGFEELFADRFPAMPEVSFTAQNVHPSLQGIVSPAFYMTPAIDDYTNNHIYIDPSQQEDLSRIWNTYAHEGIPGHMYQFTYYLDTHPEPIRAVCDFDGYAEGWATYVENMSFDYYDYGENQESYAAISRINNELNLLLSARIEIGVNYEGWDLKQAQDYMAGKGFGTEIEDLYTYVIAEPANYQMYCTGWLEFEDLKTYAREALGEKFDEKEFHKVILDAGPSKFYQLKSAVDAYIEEQ